VTGLCSAARGDAQTNPFRAWLSMLLRYRYTGTTAEEASGGWSYSDQRWLPLPSLSRDALISG